MANDSRFFVPQNSEAGCTAMVGPTPTVESRGLPHVAPDKQHSARPFLICLAGIVLLVHFFGSSRYGFFRDELYYIACGNHLAWGYIDQPPLIAAVARVSAALFGNSLAGFRFFPACADALLILLAGSITRELGGRRLAQIFAGTAALLAPVYLAFGSFLP